MKYTKIPENTFKELQMNAGILAKEFDPKTGIVNGLFGATTGGNSFADTLTTTDLGEDIDNCPKNMMELKQIESHEVKLSGTFVSLSAQLAKTLAAAADIDPDDPTHIIPRNNLTTEDFQDVWFIGDYSDVNTGENAGFLAVRVMNALNTSGFQIKSTDKAKGTFAFEFTGHYSLESQDQVPYEIYIKSGSNEAETPKITIDQTSVTVAVDGTVQLTATTNTGSENVVWKSESDDTATVTNEGLVTGVQAGTTNVTATVTIGGVDYTATCEVIVEGV